MPKDKTPPIGSRFEDAFDQVRAALAGDASRLLSTATAAADSRARRLAASEARLAEHLGTDHPRVADLTLRRERLEAARHGLDFERQRIADERPLRPGEWLATGRVVGENGEALDGFRVLVYDGEQGSKDVLGDELTDAAGEFRAEYHRRDFADEQDGTLPTLTVAVMDRDGKPVFRTDEPVPANSTRRNRFEIMLTDERLSEGVDRQRCTAITASGKRCRNPAQPGSDCCAVHAKDVAAG